jgi:hypothetical protein
VGYQRRPRMWMIWLGSPLGSIGVVLMLLSPERWGSITGICAIAVATLLVCGSRSFGARRSTASPHQPTLTPRFSWFPS